MLILSRKINESIVIDGEIEIKVVSLDDGRVRLGIVAPSKVEIHRKEVFEKIREENMISSESAMRLDALKQLKK